MAGVALNDMLSGEALRGATEDSGTSTQATTASKPAATDAGGSNPNPDPGTSTGAGEPEQSSGGQPAEEKDEEDSDEDSEAEPSQREPAGPAGDSEDEDEDEDEALHFDFDQGDNAQEETQPNPNQQGPYSYSRGNITLSSDPNHVRTADNDGSFQWRDSSHRAVNPQDGSRLVPDDLAEASGSGRHGEEAPEEDGENGPAESNEDGSE
jgi:hypothetical protein